MSAIKERIDGPGIEFGQIQGPQGADFQLNFELEHADQVSAFGAELLQGFPSPDDSQRAIVVFDSSESRDELETDHEQLDLRMDSGENELHTSLWLNFQIAHHRNRRILSNTRISRRRSR